MGPWSYSSLNAYRTCPRQFHEVRLLRAWPVEETEQSKWGTEVHKAIEERILNGTELPENMRQFQPIVDRFRSATGEIFAERKVALDREKQPVDFDSESAWVRAIIDCLILQKTKALAIDWKTGKRKPIPIQLLITSAILFHIYPELEKVVTTFVWLSQDVMDIEVVYRKDANKIWDLVSKDLKEMEWSFETGKWPERPSGLCKAWCPVITCQHNGRRLL
jgi:hypothetical protein